MTATVGLWLFWSEYSNLSTLAWWYDRTQPGQIEAALPSPDYDLNTLPWKSAHPRVFELLPHQMTLVTDPEPFAYQVFATVNTEGASSAAIRFEADIESGGMTIGLLQAGKWIAVNSSQRPGVFADTNSALLGYRRSMTVMIANNNPAGETRLRLKSLRLYLQK
jgi:hypothetical protein